MQNRIHNPGKIFLLVMVSLLFAACGGGGGDDDNDDTFDAALSYTVTDPAWTRRFVTSLDGAGRLEVDNPSGFPGPQFSPDRQYLAYAKNDRLYVVNVDGRAIQLSRFQHALGTIRSFAWAPNSRMLAYIGDADVEDDFNAYVVAVDGSSHTQINPELPDVFVSDELAFSPASDWITYRANQNSMNLREGYVSRVDGTENRRFTGTISDPAIDLEKFTWSPDGRYIAYNVNNLLSYFGNGLNTHDTSIGGRNSVRISHDFSAYALVARLDKFQWSVNSNLVAYSLRINRSGADGGDAIRRLFTASPGVSGSSAETINGPMNNDIEVGDWSWSPDGNYVAYEVVSLANTSPIIRQDQGINTYDVVLGGNGNTNSRRITETTGGPLGQGFKSITGMTWTPDSRYVLYLSLIEKSNTRELYRSPPNVSASSTLLSLDTGISNDDDVGSFALAPDGRQVAFSQRSLGVGSPFDIYLTDVDVPLVDTPLSTAPVAGGQLGAPSIQWSSRSTHIAFATDAATVGKRELYVAPNNGSGSHKVSGSIAADADVSSFTFID